MTKNQERLSRFLNEKDLCGYITLAKIPKNKIIKEVRISRSGNLNWKKLTVITKAIDIIKHIEILHKISKNNYRNKFFLERYTHTEF